MDHILGLKVRCAVVTNLLHGNSVLVFCCHSGELYTCWAPDRLVCVDPVLGTVDSKLYVCVCVEV